MSTLPQYYSILNIPTTSTADQVRAAYKRESLKTHPDRLPGNATPQERRKATERFVCSIPHPLLTSVHLSFYLFINLSIHLFVYLTIWSFDGIREHADGVLDVASSS